MKATLEQLAGFAIERQVVKQIQDRYAVVLTAAIKTNGHGGPRMEGGERAKGNGSRLPDAQIYGPGRRGWLEVKAKSRPNVRRDHSRYEHGFNATSILDYRDIQTRTGVPVYIVVCESSTGNVLIADLTTMDAAGSPRSDILYGEPMIHYDRRAFTQVGTFDAPDGNACNIVIAWDWDAVSSFLSQFAFDFSTAGITT